jgi:acyl carrier protein
VANLERYSGVEGAAVAAHNGAAGPELTAYVVLAKDARITDVDLREFLAKRVPDYMVPAQFVLLKELPLTPNGKLNKAMLPPPTEANRLPSPAALSTPAKSNAAAGGDDLQAQIAELVASLLNRPSVEPTDNFFLLGGHSMLAAQLVARVDDLFGVKLNLRQLFTAPTVVQLTAEVARRRESKHV